MLKYAIIFLGHPIYSSCLAFVYCGLDDQECLRLSARHNMNGHFNHKMRHRDYVSQHNIHNGKDDYRVHHGQLTQHKIH